MVQVKVKFYGPVGGRLGIKEMEMDVETDIDKAVGAVKDVIVSKAGNDVLFNILVNGVSYSAAKKDGSDIKQGDEIAVIPVTLGG